MAVRAAQVATQWRWKGSRPCSTLPRPRTTLAAFLMPAFMRATSLEMKVPEDPLPCCLASLLKVSFRLSSTPQP